MKKQNLKIVVLAVALTLLPAVAIAATDTITGTQDYAATDSAGQAYTQYVFDGTNPELVFTSTSGVGQNPEFPDVYALGGVNMVTNGEINWDDVGDNNSIYVYDNTAQTGTGTLTVSTAPAHYSGSDQDYLNFHLIGDQSLGANDLIFNGAGDLFFGSKSLELGDTQTLTDLDLGDNNGSTGYTNNDFSGVVRIYNADLNIKNITDTSPKLLHFMATGGANSLTSSNISARGGAAFSSGLGAVTYRVQNVTAPIIAVGSGGKVTTKITQTSTQSWTSQDQVTNGQSGEWSTTSSSSSTSSTGGTTFDAANGTLTGTVALDAKSVNFYDETINGSLDLVGGNLFIEPGAALAVTGNYVQGPISNYQTGQQSSGGNLYIPITPSVAYGINTGGNYAVSGGNVIVDGETGTYKNGSGYTLLKSALDSGNSFDPNAVYYVYNGSDSGTIGGLTPYLTKKADQVNLCLGSDCVAAPAPAPTPAKSSPAKSSPAPIKIHVVTPVQEASHTLVSTPSLTIQQARDASQVLVSSGIVGGGPRGLWFKGLGGAQHIGNENGANYGLIAGYGWSVGQGGDDVAGVAFSAGQSAMGTGPQDFAKASDYALWTYGTAYFPLKNPRQMFKIAGTLGAGLSTNSVSSTALGLPQVADFGGHFVSGEIRASFWDTLPGLDNLIVSPRLSLGYTQSWTQGYQTHGGSFLNVHVHSASSGQLYIEQAVLIGKKFNYRTVSGNHTLFPQVRLGIVQNIGPTPSAMVSSGQVAAQVAGLGYPHVQGMAEVRLDVTSHTKYSRGLSGNISVKQLFGGGASSTEAIAAIKYRW